ncbi:MAG: hypothetical protein J5477_00875 [Schwartzia sp.]|nr:hypothetical protein [Schwartzia sp. (in: firmicutes)]MBR5162641.1 hypothetical protein [Schwartzia sp. (in: firmicutes)]
MLNYRIDIEGKGNPLPIVYFADEGYELAATFLLAEARNFGSAIVDALEAVTGGQKDHGSFAGNVFSLEITPETTTICDDISGKECEIGTQDLQEVAEEYCAAYERLTGK